MSDEEKKDALEEKLAGMAPPPVDFRLFLEGFVGQALVAMGKIPHPVTGKTETDLAWARYFIDLLGLLETKTKGNLDEAEARVLEQQLSTLRLTFVETKKEAEAEDSGEDASSS